MATVAATGDASSQGGREARRRRILERGSDRLALITGQIQSLPPEPEQSRPRTTPADSVNLEDDKISDLPLLNHESGTEPSQHQCQILEQSQDPSPLKNEKVENTSSREAEEPLGALRSTSTSRETTKEPLTTSFNENKPRSITSRAAALLGVEEELSRITSSIRGPEQGQDHQRTKTLQNTRTPTQLRSAIAATENIRICSSAAAAILVILSYMGFSVLGIPGIRSVILLKPVLMLLLTNISIVVARIIPADSRKRQTAQASVVGMGKAIETGLMLQDIITALLMDFGIYAILLVCGLSLIQRFGR